jgi:hypothetical protein
VVFGTEAGATADRSARPQVAAFRAGPQRARVRRGGRPVTLRFRSSRSGAVTLLIEGPGPSCRIAGRLKTRAHRGTNRVRFTGTFRGRALDPGTYRVRPAGSPEAVAFVTIVPRGAGPDYKGTRPRCVSDATATLALPAYLAPFRSPWAGATSNERTKPGARKENDGQAWGGTLGVSRPDLPLPQRPDPEELPMLIGAGLLAVMSLTGLGLLAYVLWYVRRSRTEAV